MKKYKNVYVEEFLRMGIIYKKRIGSKTKRGIYDSIN